MGVLYQGIRIGYGRKSGYGGYGGALASKPGSRMIQLTVKSDGTAEWDTWILEDSGEKVVQSPQVNANRTHGKCCGIFSLSDVLKPVLKPVEDIAKNTHICRVMDDASACRAAVGLPAVRG